MNITCRTLRGPFINYVTLFPGLFTLSLPVTKCHTKLPPHNYVTHLSNPHPPENRGVLLTTIRPFTEQHMIEATLQFSPRWTQMFVYRDNSNLFFTVVDRLNNRNIRRVQKLFIQPFDVHSTFYFLPMRIYASTRPLLLPVTKCHTGRITLPQAWRN